MCCPHWFWFSLLFYFYFLPHTLLFIQTFPSVSSIQYLRPPSILFGLSLSLSHTLSLSDFHSWIVCFIFSFRVARLLFSFPLLRWPGTLSPSIHDWIWWCTQLFRCFGSAWRYFIPKSPPATNASNCLCKEEVPTSIRWTLYRRAYRWLSISHSLYLSRSRYQLFFI